MLSRRDLLNKTAVMSAGWAAAGLIPSWARAQSSGLSAPASEFDLAIGRTSFSVDGRRGGAVTVNGGVPGPLLRWREGDEVTLRLANALDEDASIHWHGILLPASMDGVPGVSFAGIAPGETFTYRFPVRQSGTYWYHSHSGFQEQSGVYGPIIIDPAGGERVAADREYVVMLSDWTFEDPARVFANLKRQPDYYNYQRRTLGDFLRDAREEGWSAAMEDRRMWAEMRMNPTDIADVTGATYTYLMNGHGPEANWMALFRPGERVRLRFINGSAMTYFDVRIPGLPMTVVAADGVDVAPVETDEFRMAVAETYDVIVEPREDRAFTIFAESMDRSGYARGTLATREGATADVPARRPRPVRSMADMGHDMSGHDTDGAGGQMTHEASAAPAMSGEAMDHAGHDAGHDMAPTAAASGHEGHDMAAMASGATSAEAMDHAGHDMAEMAGMASEQGDPVRAGPGVAMRAMAASTRLDDPGIGLGADGWRVLSYAQLRGARDLADRRAPARELELHLTSNMERYMWSFDGVRFADVDGPIQMTHGERLRLVLVNDTMMEHPIHLHGMFVELDNGAGERRPLKHTVNVKPGERVPLLLTADEPGDWAFHCHLLYHMAAGMMRVVRVSQPETRA
ncbi:MAG: copper resistance system multicopper oxidase [Maricaulaceae bacterium]|jgi:CopA family copper-resistance protein